MSIQAAANIPEAYRFLRNAIKHAFLDAGADAHAGPRPQMVLITSGIANPFSILAVVVGRDKGKSDRLARVGVSAPGR
jgi:hypothetical protein